jgi:methionyl-tRNA formyltransferase
MAIRVVYFGNSASTFTARHLAALLDTPCDLVAVVDVPAARRDTTNPLPDGLQGLTQTAQKQGIPDFEPASPNKPQFVEALRQLEPDLFIAAGYALILKEKVLAVPRLLAANFHASLLPAYQGKHPVFWALRGGERWAGLTVHAMDLGIDTGDILYQVKVPTRRDDTVASLYRRIVDRSRELVGRLIADAERGAIPRRSQPADGGSYFSSTTDDDFHLSWHWPAEKIRRHVTITPGRCYAITGQQRVYFHNAETEPLDDPLPPGTLLRIGRTRAAVTAGTGALSSSQVQVAGGDIESFAGFCRRMGLRLGDRLERSHT